MNQLPRHGIAILGGTFDPIHQGHLQLANTVYDQLPVQEIRFMPSAQSPLKQAPVATAAQRLRLIELAIKNNPHFTVDTREIQQQKTCFTYDTLKTIRTEFTQTPLLFVMSMDQFLQFDQWHQWQHINDLAHLIISNRPGYHAELNSTLKKFLEERSTNDPKQLINKPSGYTFLLQCQALDISSSKIREQLTHGQSCKTMLPENVYQFLLVENLYL